MTTPEVPASIGPGLDPEATTRLRVAVTRLGRLLQQHSNAGLTLSQQSVLFTVEVLGPVSLGELAVAEAVQPPSVTRCVSTLVEQGLLARTISEDDRRVTKVNLTQQGRRVVRQMRQQRAAMLARWLGRLSAEEMENLLGALPAMEHLVELA